MNFWLRWVVVAALQAFSSCGEPGFLIALASLVGRAQAPGHTGFSNCGAQA